MYIVNNHHYKEDPNLKLGGGSEGTVYPFPDDSSLCVKIFHSPVSTEDKKIANYRAKKIKFMCDMNAPFPSQFILPQLPAYNEKGKIIGFTMNRMPAEFVKVMQLLTPFRATYGINLKKISLYFADLFTDMKDFIHKLFKAIGDINVGCVMVNPRMERAWVDTDSWSVSAQFPCLGTTELFCHPDLYSNLSSSGGIYLPHEAYHDRFSMVVMYLLMALPGAHVFKMGTSTDYPSIQERAINGKVIFDPDVIYPSFCPPPELLSDDLLNILINVLKRKEDDFDYDCLRAFADELVTCPNCDEQYHSSRVHCPKCHEKTLVDVSKLLEFYINEKFFTTGGKILFAQVIDEVLLIACNVNGKLQIITIDKNHSSVINTDLDIVLGAQYRFFDSNIVVCENPYANAPVSLDIYHIEKGNIEKVCSTTTNRLENAPAVFGTSSNFLYRVAGNTLLCGQTFGKSDLVEEPVLQLHQSQSWFTIDRNSGANREAIFGFDRSLQDYQWFVARGHSDGSKFVHYDVDLKSMRVGEKLEDFQVYFNANFVLLVRKTLYRGKDFVRYSIISLEGVVQKDEIIKSTDEEYPYWENIRGKLYQKSGVLHITPNGVVKHTFNTNIYQPLRDTEGIVMLSDTLIRFGKMIGVVRSKGVLTIEKK